MVRKVSLLIISFLLFPLSGQASPGYTFTPGPTIAMTGSNGYVFFDVADDIINSGSLVPPPRLITETRTFSGAFYLSGAGWVDFSTGSYRVRLDCGAQSLSGLTQDCSLTGVAYSEMIGDIVFSGARFIHTTGEIVGTLSTFIGNYPLSGVQLPLFPAFFAEGTGSTADRAKSLSLSGVDRYFGPDDWDISIIPLADTRSVCTRSGAIYTCDFSMASDYSVEISDPNDSRTTFTYTVSPGTPSSTSSFGGTFHETFCSTNSSDSRCPDGANLSVMTLSKIPSAGVIVANGTDTYNLTLKIRDQYGNRVDSGSVFIEYIDNVSEIQVPIIEGPPYISYGPGYAVSGSLNNGYGKFFFSIPTITGDISYSFSSIAPTNASNTLSLSGIIFNGTDITDSSWKEPLIFTPWYDASLSVVGNIVIGTGVSFSGSIKQNGSVSISASPVYLMTIGSDNILASFSGFTDTMCAKYRFSSGSGLCNWGDIYSVVHVPSGSYFTGIYTPHIPNPPLESVSYKSYITYEKGGVRVLYPSTSGSLGGAEYAESPLLLLGQSNLGNRYGGIGSKSRSDFWNTLRKNTMLLSRNRTHYTDVDYTISTGSIVLGNDSFTTKRTIIALGGDIHIREDILKRDRPLAIIALSDSAGNGGDITIDPSVRNISLSLFAEKGISSSGSSQLVIFGSVISANTTGGATISPPTCPYFVTSCDRGIAEKYDLEKLRPDFDKTTSLKASGSVASANPGIATIIEYDGRILSDPPPGVEK